MQPLDNIKVLDFSTLLPGPLAGLVLAEAGADVVKIERPGFGEEMRHYQPKWGRDSAGFALLNRGKRAMAIDLKDKQQVARRLKPLICEADILLEQFRPGVMERLGLGYETVKQWNPLLIYCSITGYGQSGPKAKQVGHDLNYIGDSGLLDLSMGPAENPTVPPGLIADIGGGTYPALVNILLALIARQRSNQGCHLDIAMTDHLFMWMFWAQGQGLASGQWPASGEGLLTGGSPRYQIYPTKDGKHVAAAPIEEKFWRVFCDLIGLPEALVDCSDHAKVIDAIRAIIKKQPASYWQRTFDRQDCCCTIVASLKQAMNDHHFKHRGLFEQKLLNENDEQMAALPVCVVGQFRRKTENGMRAPATGDSDL